MSLMTHAGGWNAKIADLAAVAVPEDTGSYVAVPYPRYVEEVKLHVPRFGLTVESEEYALARGGNQMFGVLTCRNGQVADWGLAIGLRSSYDRSIAVELVAGSRVFVCDNLAFHGEVGTHVRRKHTANVFRDLPDLIYRMLTSVSAMKDRIGTEIEQMKATQLAPPQAHHLMVQAVRANALAASRLPLVMGGYDELSEDHSGERTAWLLFNAFTSIIRCQPPRLQMDNTLRLSSLFRRELSLN
jgi:hypothetical protein